MFNLLQQVYNYQLEQLQNTITLANIENFDLFKQLLEKNQINIKEICNPCEIFYDQGTLNNKSMQVLEKFYEIYKQKYEHYYQENLLMSEIYQIDFLKNYFELWGFIKKTEADFYQNSQEHFISNEQYAQQLIDVFNQFCESYYKDQLLNNYQNQNNPIIEQSSNDNFLEGSEDQLSFQNIDIYRILNSKDADNNQYQQLQKQQYLKRI